MMFQEGLVAVCCVDCTCLRPLDDQGRDETKGSIQARAADARVLAQVLGRELTCGQQSPQQHT